MAALQPMRCDTNLHVCTSWILTTDISGSREQKTVVPSVNKVKKTELIFDAVHRLDGVCQMHQ